MSVNKTMSMLSVTAACVLRDRLETDQKLIDAIACVSCDRNQLSANDAAVLDELRAYFCASLDSLVASITSTADLYAQEVRGAIRDAYVATKHHIKPESGAELLDRCIAEHRVLHTGEGHLS